MSGRRTPQALGVALATALVCALLVTGTHLLLAPSRGAGADMARFRSILQVSGLLPAGPVTDPELRSLMRQLDRREIRVGAAGGTGRTTTDAFLVWKGDDLQRVILPVSGQGMWAPIGGYLALEPDLATIAAVTFSELNETPGIGDKVQDPAWRASWQGKRVYDESGAVRFALAGRGQPDSRYQVDAITGATVTSTAVVSMTRHWLGPEGYGPWLEQLRREGAKPP